MAEFTSPDHYHDPYNEALIPSFVAGTILDGQFAGNGIEIVGSETLGDFKAKYYINGNLIDEIHIGNQQKVSELLKNL
jgi:hypothetical protein